MKKRSAAKPLEPIVFFIDRSLGKYDVPEALRAAGHACEIHDDRFPQDTEDAVWLSALVGQNRVVLTKDERIRYRPLEYDVLRKSGLRVFIALCGNVTGGETARIILKAIPRVLQVVQAHGTGPLIGYIYKNGTIKLD